MVKDDATGHRRLTSCPSMSADHEGSLLCNGDRLTTVDMREPRSIFAPSSMDSPRYGLSSAADAYCQHCSCIAASSTPESASQTTVYGIDYLRYWDCW